jgi:hypothetical protein
VFSMKGQSPPSVLRVSPLHTRRIPFRVVAFWRMIVVDIIGADPFRDHVFLFVMLPPPEKPVRYLEICVRHVG